MKSSMNWRLISATALLAIVGCTPEQFVRPPIPDTVPSKPTSSVVQNSVVPHSPVTPAQVNEQNAAQKLKELENEIDADARVSTPR